MTGSHIFDNHYNAFLISEVVTLAKVECVAEIFD